MHELAIAESIIDIVRAQAEAGKFSRVNGVRLQVGELNGVVPDSLRFCFEMAAKGTPAEGARLEIDLLPVTALCGDCGREFAVEGYAFACSHCGSARFQITGGRELRITELEVEPAEAGVAVSPAAAPPAATADTTASQGVK